MQKSSIVNVQQGYKYAYETSLPLLPCRTLKGFMKTLQEYFSSTVFFKNFYFGSNGTNEVIEITAQLHSTKSEFSFRAFSSLVHSMLN